MTTPDTLIESILAAAVELHTPAERHAYIAQACGGDTELQKQVEQMLENYFQAGSFLETPAPGLPKTIAYPQETVGKIVGPYKLLEKLGEGGMGTVWIAEREKPVRQRVALKLIKPGMDSAQVLRRFEAERQALALMTHHNIARMLDAGTTEAGRPYFVMELVKGVPITKYCDEVHAPIEERLKLFIPVCLAVQHAHQKGIIHRDIKPSNVLVCMEDGQPVPKVIDFGVAKALYQPLTEGTLHTAFNQIVGTLEYMSPEQAELNALDIDTRADIYALGVLLFELLTGSTPITREELKTLALMGMLRKIKESEPKKPSTRLSESKDTLASVAASRRSDPRRLMKEIAGDLDWIVLKCLEPDRMRRYETANAVAREIERHLANEPVEARAPSRGYRLKKFVVRNRWAVAATVMILLALLTGVVGLAWGLREAEQGRQLAERKEGEAKQSEEKALKRLSQIEKGNEILGSIFKDLDPQSEEKEGKSLRVILGERLGHAAKQINDESIGDPIAVARIQMALGESLLGLGYPEKSVDLFEKVFRARQVLLGSNHADTKDTMSWLGRCYDEVRRHQDALRINEELFAMQNSTLGPNHEDTLAVMGNLAISYSWLARTEEAIKLGERLLVLLKAKYGGDHKLTMVRTADLAAFYSESGRYQDALKLQEAVFAWRKAHLGAGHIDTISSMNHIADTYLQIGRVEESFEMCKEMVKLSKANLGQIHYHTIGAAGNLAVHYWRRGELDKSIPLFEEVLKLRQVKAGRDSIDAIACMGNLGVNYLDAGRNQDALMILDEAWELAQKYRPFTPTVLPTLPTHVGRAYLSASQFAKAEPLFREQLALFEKYNIEKDRRMPLTRSLLGITLVGLKKYEEAETLLKQGYDGLSRQASTHSLLGKKMMTESVNGLIDLYTATNKPAEVAKWKAELEQVKARLEQAKTAAKPENPSQKK